MSEERTHNVTLKAKGMEAFVSEDVAQHLFNRPGERRLMLIEVHTTKRELNENGTKRVMLSLDTAELIPEEFEVRFRDAMRALYLNREDETGQTHIPVDGETVQDRDSALDGAAAAIEETVESEPEDEDAAPTEDGEWSGDTDEESEGEQAEADIVVPIDFSSKAK